MAKLLNTSTIADGSFLINGGWWKPTKIRVNSEGVMIRARDTDKVELIFGASEWDFIVEYVALSRQRLKAEG